ncbi:hypothetical protein WICPIJ_002268 [Wickerhamomyces pijperi]|uniref:DNA-directed DNA polymerase n=1 Tax=Wickerhamomyces pijperi TaxID=599730 RepID=A0A9P8TPT8_WICPI|nr:hypothetical protein WICPIJ_002268 [Wickerhamomyces pijperi]
MATLQEYKDDPTTPSSSPLKRPINPQIPTPYKNETQFQLQFNARPYEKQFNKIYYSRLHQLRPRISHNGTKKWSHELIKDQPIVKKDKVLEIQMDQPSWCIGTIYREMKYKPNILQEVTRGSNGNEIPDVNSYIDLDLDEIFLEDESGRVKLTGDILTNSVFVTGVVVGVLGVQLTPGIFSVLDVVYPFAAAQKPTRVASGKIAFVSGLEFNGLEDYRHDLLAEYLTGGIDTDKAQQLKKLVIIGDSVNISELEPESESQETKSTSNSNKIKYGAKNKSNFSIDSITQLDQFLSELAPSIPIELIPGETDPVEISLPQQPFHPSFFPNSKQYIGSTVDSSLRNLTNPCWLQYEDLRVLAIAGQNINDIYKYQNCGKDSTSEISRINMIESTLIWQNIIPTAPDTLFCYPYEEKDPFCLNEIPHVYVVGNQPSFEETTVSFKDRGLEVKAISVPKFKQTGEIIILDLAMLECEAVRIC